jgi:hypothetical protein
LFRSAGEVGWECRYRILALVESSLLPAEVRLSPPVSEPRLLRAGMAGIAVFSFRVHSLAKPVPPVVLIV